MLRGLLAALVAASAVGGHAHLAREASFTKLDTTVTMSDGVKLAATYYEPAGPPPAGGWPAVMMFHGLGQTRNSLDLNTWSANKVAETYLAPNGFAVLTFDARAHGQSGGLFSLDGPRELQDTKELFGWLTAHANVNRSKVGAFGVSYGGGIVWLAAAAGVPFATIAVAATWTDLHQALIPEGLVRAGIILGFANSVSPARYAPELNAQLAILNSEGDPPDLRAFFDERSVRSRLSDIRIPVFLLQGRDDFVFDADQAITAYRLLKGPKRLYLGDLGHAPAANPADEVPHFADEVLRWFEQSLRPGIGPNLISPGVELAQDPWNGKTVSYPSLPPTRTLRFTSRQTSRLTAQGRVVRTFPRVPHLETFGAPSLRVALSTRTHYRHLVAVLSWLSADGKERVITDGGIELPKLTKKPREITIRLPDEITPVPAGSQLHVTLGATSTAQDRANIVYLLPVADGSTLTIGRVTLTLPVLKRPISQ